MNRSFPHPVNQNHVAFAGAVGTVVQILRIVRMAIEHVEAMHMLELLHQCLLDLVLGNKIRHQRSKDFQFK